MDQAAPEVWLVRHGETEWSRSGRHTGRTDLPLTTEGEAAAGRLVEVLHAQTFALALSSPLQRAQRTAALAGFPDVELTDDLVEWDYGRYEGLTRDEIRSEHPGWEIWTHGGPEGESPEQVQARVDRVIERCRAVEGRCLLFAHGHVLRALAARWIEHPVTLGEYLRLDTSRVSVLSIDRGTPVLDRWNSER
jgi:broad specificity phosphatase PhoE